MSSEGKSKFSCTALLVVMVVVFLLFLALIPFLISAGSSAGMMATGARGKDIFVAITGANTEREPLGLPDVWPRTPIGGGRKIEDVRWAPDIAQMEFQNSTDYFNELMDGANFRTDKWAPYVSRLDYSKFAGAGVPMGDEREKLRPENNMWSIAGDLEDDMDDILPVLVTRNVDCASFYKMLQGDGTEKIEWWSKHYKTPYSNKGFFVVRKGGAVFSLSSRYVNVQTLLPVSFDGNAKDFILPPYLTPDSLVTPPQRSSP